MMDVSRFIPKHEQCYSDALKEIKNGRKVGHWMWYIFPQMAGLGVSSHSYMYGISSLEEAKAFLEDPYLGKNLVEISEALMNLQTNNPKEIFGSPDDKKLRSSMTLFSLVSEEGSVFHRVLDKYFDGRIDRRTLKILGVFPD